MRKMIKRSVIALLIGLTSLMPLDSCFAANKTYSSEATQLYNEAVMAYRTRHFNLAKQCFYKLIEQYPDDRMADIARSNLAGLLKDLKEYDKAIEIYKEIIEALEEFDIDTADYLLDSMMNYELTEAQTEYIFRKKS